MHASLVKTKSHFRPSSAGGGVLRQGYLSKQSAGLLKRWQKRYFSICNHYLNYYADEHQSGLKGSYDLRTIVSVEVDDRQITLRFTRHDIECQLV